LKIPPQNLEAEQSVLGALLIDQDAIVTVAEILKPENFYREAHGNIYRCILSLFERREPVDLVTLTEELKKAGIYDEVGGSTYLAELANIVPTAAHVAKYSSIVKDHHTKRELISLAAKISEMSFGETGDVKEILDTAEQAIFAVSQRHLAQNFVNVGSVLEESFDRLEELGKRTGALRGLPTGFVDLDEKLAGLQDSNLIILASRPGQGKTTLAVNIAQHIAVKEKLPVGIFSLEMSMLELVDRLLVSTAEVDAWRYKTGRLEEEDFARLQEAMGILAEAPLFIDDTPANNILEMRTKARRLQVEQGLRFLIVDYIQLIRGRQLENRVQEVSEISQNLKNLARELKIPILAVSQLSRAVEQRGSKKPQLADLRESGALEQDADVVMFIYREDPDNPDNVKLAIEKHRNGPTGELDFYFQGNRFKFYGIEGKREKEPLVVAS